MAYTGEEGSHDCSSAKVRTDTKYGDPLLPLVQLSWNTSHDTFLVSQPLTNFRLNVLRLLTLSFRYIKPRLPFRLEV